MRRGVFDHFQRVLVSRRTIIRIAIIVGALLGATVPYFAGGGSVSFFTDIEARIGYGLLSVVVHAMFGAAAGWAVAALVVSLTSRDGGSPER
jgi:hypothetical protein